MPYDTLSPTFRRVAAVLALAAVLVLGARGRTAAADPPAPWILDVDYSVEQQGFIVVYHDPFTWESGLEIGVFTNEGTRLQRTVRLPAQPGMGDHAFVIRDGVPEGLVCFRIRALMPPSDQPSLFPSTVWSDIHPGACLQNGAGPPGRASRILQQPAHVSQPPPPCRPCTKARLAEVPPPVSSSH
jgi:hypothetical protein